MLGPAWTRNWMNSSRPLPVAGWVLLAPPIPCAPCMPAMLPVETATPVTPRTTSVMLTEQANEPRMPTAAQQRETILVLRPL